MRNHLKHFLLLAVLTICFTATAVAQGTVKGKVVDAENNEPLIGATVSVSGTTLGTVTDIDGNFVLKLTSSKAMFYKCRHPCSDIGNIPWIYISLNQQLVFQRNNFHYVLSCSNHASQSIYPNIFYDASQGSPDT